MTRITLSDLIEDAITPDHVPVNLASTPVSSNNSSTTAANTTAFNGFDRFNNAGSSTPGSFIEYDVLLGGGRWRVDIGHRTFTNRGIVTLSIDGVSIGTYDGYLSSSTQVLSSIVFTLTGETRLRRLRLEVKAKNASASAYVYSVSALAFNRLQTVGDPAAITLHGDLSTVVGAATLVTNNQTWKATQVREPGQVIEDPNPSVPGRTWLFTYAGQAATGNVGVGVAFSQTGALNSFTDYASNPIVALGEDPYIVKDIRTGKAYRDGSNKLHMFSEEKTAGVALSQNGINHHTSTDGITWAADPANPVIGPGSGWDGNDRTSPVVFYDGTSFTMLYEGRGVGNNGEIGVARKANLDGTGWTMSGTQIITKAGAGWRQVACVPDDIILVDGRYVFLAHGEDGSSVWSMGRFSTLDAPSAWAAGSFVEMPGNPFDSTSSQVMLVGNDGLNLIRIADATQNAVTSATVVTA